MTSNITVADHTVGNWCPVCMNAWTVDMVPVRVKIRWHIEVICGQCAREMGITARKEQRRRHLESEAVRGRKREVHG